MEEIDLKELFGFFKSKLAIFLIVIAVVCGLGGAYSAFIQKPQYSANTSIILNGSEQTITQSDVTLNNSLASTYAEVVKSRRVLDKVKEKLQLEQSREELAAQVSVSNDNKTSLIRITTVADDPAEAVDIANATAYFFTQEVAEFYKLDNVNVLDEAIMNEKPSNLSFGKSILIYLAIGFVLACGIVFMMFYFDPSIKSADDVENRTHLQILGKIHNSRRVRENELVTREDPKAVISEDVRTVRTNLLLSMDNKKQHTFLITSSIPGEGKSFVSSNLAITLAQNGKSVLLIDCDMRRGRLHEIFNCESKDGLSNLLSHNITLENIRRNLCPTDTSHLYIITRGETPNNPSELLGARIDELVEKVKDKFDYVLLDGTPIQGLPDSLTLSHVADSTVLVCASGHTSMNVLLNTQKSLKNVNAKIAGIVYNHDKSSSNGYYGRYYGEEE